MAKRAGRLVAGTTLIELMVVIGIVGMFCLFALPSALSVFDRVQLRNARSALINRYNGARMAARVANRTVVFRAAQNRIIVERNHAQGGGKDTVAVTNLADLYGVLLSGPDSIRIDPRGILESKLSPGVKYVLTRGEGADSVELRSYGRVVR